MKFYVTRTSVSLLDATTAPTTDKRAYFDAAATEGTGEWVIELNTLQELTDFIQQNGGTIVLSIYKNFTPELEIYDDYRE